MERLEDIAFEINFQVTEKEMTKISDGLESVKKLVLEISKPMDKLLSTMAQGLQKIEGNISGLTDAMTAATSAMQALVYQLPNEQLGEALQVGATAAEKSISDIVEIAQAAFEGVIGAMTSLGIEKLMAEIVAKSGTIAGSLSGMVVAILAVVAAIAAVIIYWDELVLLFSETIPQFIEQNAALAESFNGAGGMFYDMCQSMVTNWMTHSGSLLLAFSTFRTGMEELWNYITTAVVEPAMSVLGELFDGVWEQHLKPLWDNITGFILTVSENIIAFWNGYLKPIVDWITTILAPIVIAVIDIIAGAVEWVVGVVSGYLGGLIDHFEGIIQFITGVFTGDWEKAWEGIVSLADGALGIIGSLLGGAFDLVSWVIESLATAFTSLVAGVVNAIDGLLNGVGKLFGKNWGFSIPASSIAIPYLAKGAVLPANKPFLAVVGDQKHGTNVEAPLATIQEAVALVMDDHISAMMAGFEALLQEQRAIRQTVEGIEIGDSVIGRAAQRYNRKMAIVKGGY